MAMPEFLQKLPQPIAKETYSILELLKMLILYHLIEIYQKYVESMEHIANFGGRASI